LADVYAINFLGKTGYQRLDITTGTMGWAPPLMQWKVIEMKRKWLIAGTLGGGWGRGWSPAIKSSGGLQRRKFVRRTVGENPGGLVQKRSQIDWVGCHSATVRLLEAFRRCGFLVSDTRGFG